MSVAPLAAIVRIQTNVGCCDKADAIVTVTTTKTIIREHETDLVVREARAVAADVVVLTLADPRGGELPPWTPGAHVDLILGDDLTRQYSLCSSPSTPDVWRLGVLRAPDSRGGSEWVHTALGPGTTVRVRGPRNHFPLVSSPRYLFIAGGIGITPILPMIAEAEAAQRRAVNTRVRADLDVVFKDNRPDLRKLLIPKIVTHVTKTIRSDACAGVQYHAASNRNSVVKHHVRVQHTIIPNRDMRAKHDTGFQSRVSPDVRVFTDAHVWTNIGRQRDVRGFCNHGAWMNRRLTPNRRMKRGAD